MQQNYTHSGLRLIASNAQNTENAKKRFEDKISGEKTK